ncbi:MAG TPA: nucleotidyltransferase family protein [Candidatus Dormibacteraeota bacterium]
MSRSAGVILAAGGSTRMGRPKQLLPVHGRALLELVVTHACASALDHVVVVLGANAEVVRNAVDMGRAEVVVNADHAAGMSSSLRVGIQTLAGDVGRAVILLGDQPDVTAAQIDELLDLQKRSGLPASALSFDGLLHPPVVLERTLWPGLMELDGDVGCRRIIRAQPELVAALPASVPGRHPVDIDTPDDYARLLEGA